MTGVDWERATCACAMMADDVKGAAWEIIGWYMYMPVAPPAEVFFTEAWLYLSSHYLVSRIEEKIGGAH